MAIVPDPSAESQTKLCPDCGVVKPWGEFYKLHKSERPMRRCKPCHCSRTTKNIQRRYAADPMPFKEAAREYAAENADALKAKRTDKRLANLDETRAKERAYEATAEIKAKRAAYRAANAERRAEYDRAWYQANKAAHRAYRVVYEAAHAARYRELRERWRRDNPEKARLIRLRSHAVRKARKLNAEGSFTAEEWQAIKARQGFRCLICGMYEPLIKLTVDHVIPLSKGGSNYAMNISALCAPCNSFKRDRSWDFRDP